MVACGGLFQLLQRPRPPGEEAEDAPPPLSLWAAQDFGGRIWWQRGGGEHVGGCGGGDTLFPPVPLMRGIFLLAVFDLL
jgi:hypothetical protein